MSEPTRDEGNAPDRTAFREWILRAVDVDCRSGFYDEAAILDAIDEGIANELGGDDEPLRAEVAARVAPGLAARAVEEQGWVDRTVNDGLDDAFAALASRGILGAQALGSTVQHGWAIAELLAAERARDVGGAARGVVFYHRQDLERGVDGGGLYLAFGVFDPATLAALASRSLSPATAPDEPDESVLLGPQRADRNTVVAKSAAQATVALGREIVAMLRHYGVDAQWDESHHTRIRVPPFVWRRRRTTIAPPASSPPPPAFLDRRDDEPRAVCPDCEGRGWLPPLVPGDFSDFCWCQGGKRPRPPVESPVVESAPAESAPAESAPAESAPAEAPPAESAPAPGPAVPAEAAPTGFFAWLAKLWR